MPMPYGYHVLCRPDKAQRPEMMAVIEWLKHTLSQLN
jgi:hypothetical protein